MYCFGGFEKMNVRKGYFLKNKYLDMFQEYVFDKRDCCVLLDNF